MKTETMQIHNYYKSVADVIVWNDVICICPNEMCI